MGGQSAWGEPKGMKDGGPGDASVPTGGAGDPGQAPKRLKKLGKVAAAGAAQLKSASVSAPLPVPCRVDLSAALAAFPPSDAGGGGGGGEEVVSVEAGAQPQQQREAGKRRARSSKRPTFIYGNYNRYYGYRLSEAMAGDPRLGVFKKEWFEGKDCLDVGCNEGLATLGLAARFGTATMLGIDIDASLVGKARKSLQLMREKVEVQLSMGVEGAGMGSSLPSDALLAPPPNNGKRKKWEKEGVVDKPGSARNDGVGSGVGKMAGVAGAPEGNRYHVRWPVDGGSGEEDEEEKGEEDGEAGTGGAGAGAGPWGGDVGDDPEVAHRALGRCQFRCEDYVLTQGKNCSVDVITCLSVTKWIHLNHGDDGMRTLFAKFHRQLTPGGLLVVEPQPWKSYRSALRKQDMSAAKHADLNAIHFPPSHFIAHLQSELGFALVEKLQVPRVTSQGFDRPLFVLRKTR